MTASRYPAGLSENLRTARAARLPAMLDDPAIANRELQCANALPESEVLHRQAEAAQQQ